MTTRRILRRLGYKKKKGKVQHVCHLQKGSDSYLPRLPPNARWHARLKRRLQKFLQVWPNHPSTGLFLRSMAAIAFEKRRHGISSYWWIIHPCSRLRFFWNAIMFFIFFYMFFMIPHMLSFNRMRVGKNQSEEAIDIIRESSKYLNPGYGLCLIDIGVNFLTGFIGPDSHEILLEPILIFKSYVKSFFIIDLASSVPYTWFIKDHVGSPDEDDQLFLIVLELIPLLKMLRLKTMRFYLQDVIFICGTSRLREHVIWLIILTLLIFHWSACFTYVFPIMYAYVNRTREVTEAQGYLFKTALYNESRWYIYLSSLHMGGGNLCTYTINTDLEYTEWPDKISRCILLACGMAYFLYFTVMVLQLVSSSAEPELKYQAIMYGVKDYIVKKKLSKELKERLLHFYEHRFQGSLFKEKAITNTLSKHLRHEIIQHSSRILLEKTLILANIPRGLRNRIISALKQEIFLQGDIIYKCNMEGSSMYFIITGTVAIISCSGKEICHVSDGNYFGELALIEHDHLRIVSAIALEVCEVLRLDLRDFNRLVVKTEVYNRLELRAQTRLREVKEADGDEDELEAQRDVEDTNEKETNGAEEELEVRDVEDTDEKEAEVQEDEYDDDEEGEGNEDSD